MAKATERALVVATTSFWTTLPDGTAYVVQGGRTMLWSDHPIVRNNPKSFKPVMASLDEPEPPIEQATAAPGEKRGR
jgi:hypothetical protein